VKELQAHNETRIDEYYWMNDRENPAVINYLENENEYNDMMTAHTAAFQKSLFKEMKGRIKEDDSSVPYKLHGYWLA